VGRGSTLKYRRLSAVCSLFLGFLSGVASAEPSSQEKALASRLFDDASKLMTAGETSAACPKYAESERLDPQLGTLLHLGECYAKAGQAASAWTSFKEAADVAAQRSDARLGKIRERLASIEKNVSNLVIVVGENEPPELELRQDGALVGKASWGSPIPVDPGAHKITATAPGAKPRELTVNVAPNGQTATVTLPALERVPVAPGAKPESGVTPQGSVVSAGASSAPVDNSSGFSRHQRTIALVVGGVGVVGIGVGSAFGLMVKPTYDKSNAHCNGDHCDATGHDFRQSAFSKAEISNIAFGVGAAALIGGAVLWLTAPSHSEQQPTTAIAPVLGPRGAALSVRRSF